MTYRSERIAEILTKPIAPPRTQRPRNTNGHTYYLGDNAKAYIKSLAPGPCFVSAYLNHLAMLNGNLPDWQDTRPQELKDADRPRLSVGLLPLWTHGTDTGGPIRLNLTPQTISALARVAIAYGISRQQYVSLTNVGPARNLSFEGLRSTALKDLGALSPYVLCALTLRAYGSGFLTPRNVPVIDAATRTEISPHKASLTLGNRGRPKGTPNHSV